MNHIIITRLQPMVWLLLILSFNAMSLIENYTYRVNINNYNNTGLIRYYNYESDLNIDSNINIYYFYSDEFVKSNTEHQINQLLSETNSQSPLFVLIPRDINISLSISNDTNLKKLNPLIAMNVNLANSNLYKPEHIQTILDNYLNYIKNNNIKAHKSLEHDLKSVISGSKGLFMPYNYSRINSFDGIKRMLSSVAVTPLHEALLGQYNFSIEEPFLFIKPRIELQAKLFDCIKNANTVLFIPELIEKISPNKLRLPLAMINKVTIEEATNIIELELLLPKPKNSIMESMVIFTTEINKLLTDHNITNNNFEVVIYKLKLNTIETEQQAKKAKINPTAYFNFATAAFIEAEENSFIFINDQSQAIASNSITQNQQIIAEDFNPNLLSEAQKPETLIHPQLKIELEELLAFYKNATNNQLRETSPHLSNFINELIYNVAIVNDKNNDLNFQIGNNNISASFSELLSVKLAVALVEKSSLNNNIALKKYFFTTFNPDKENSCSHYQRRCKVKFPCCNGFWGCHKCHNEFHKDNTVNTNGLCLIVVTSKDIISQYCTRCEYIQDFDPYIGNFCQNCKTKFADYYCEICKHLCGLNRDAFHCNKCNHCKPDAKKTYHCVLCNSCHYKSSELVFCDVCKQCISIKSKNKHRCSQTECPICLDSFINKNHIAIRCGHRMHQICVENLLKTNHINCPICREPMTELNDDDLIRGGEPITELNDDDLNILSALLEFD